MLEVLYKSVHSWINTQAGRTTKRYCRGPREAAGVPELTLFKYSVLYITEKYTK